MDSTVTTVAGKALDLLRQLAQQMGTTLEYLWPRYTKYVAAHAVADAVVSGLVWIIFGVLAVVFAKLAIKFKDEGEEFFWFLTVVSSAIAIGLTFVFIQCLGNGIAASIAPEGYALTKLLTQLK